MEGIRKDCQRKQRDPFLIPNSKERKFMLKYTNVLTYEFPEA